MAGRRSTGLDVLREGALLTAGAVLLALSVDLFLVPSDLAPGGVSGLAIILRRLIGTPVGLTMLLLNLPMLVLGYTRLGRFRFLVRTVFVVLLYNLGVDVLARLDPRRRIDAGPVAERSLRRRRGRDRHGFGVPWARHLGRNRRGQPHRSAAHRRAHQPGVSDHRRRRGAARRSRLRLGEGTLRADHALRLGPGNRLCTGRAEHHPHGLHRDR